MFSCELSQQLWFESPMSAKKNVTQKLRPFSNQEVC